MDREVESSYGFIPDPSLSIHHNARKVLGDMTLACYQNQVDNLKFHDLTDGNILPASAASVIGLGLKFIPTPKFSPSSKDVTLASDRLERDLSLRIHFAGDDGPSSFDPSSSSKCRLNSTWQPPLPPREIDSRLQRFTRSVKSLFNRRKGSLNLSLFQRRILDQVRNDNNYLIVNSDKGLGPCGIERNKYIMMCLDHLKDESTYTFITEQQGLEERESLRRKIFDWTIKHRRSIGDDVTKFIRKKLDDNVEELFGVFYGLIKLHKSPISLRPVCSDMASLPHPLGQWVDEALQLLVQSQPAYFKNSYALKKRFGALTLPPNASLFTCDAVSMYTNIDTNQCLARLSKYFKEPLVYTRLGDTSPTALIEAIEIVMRSNIMRFGDCLIRQDTGVAMGISPAPTIANLFVAIHERDKVLPFLTRDCLLDWQRFIDDGIGIWLHDTDLETDRANWSAFKAAVNGGGLKWTFEPRAKKTVFMDMTLRIVNGKIETSIYAKPMALHLYIPPHSCHSPGVHAGLIMGQVLRIYQLCSRRKDIDRELEDFLRHLLARGHSLDNVMPIFTRAVDNAIKYISQSDEFRLQQRMSMRDTNSRRVFFHIPFDTRNPKSSVIQKKWRSLVSEPRGKTALNMCTNYSGAPIPVDRLVIAYSRPPNLGNILSYRKLDKIPGPKVSSYL